VFLPLSRSLLPGLVGLVGLAGGGCSSAAPVDPTGSSEQAATVESASYSVPVEPALAEAASFPVSRVRWVTDGDTALLDYALPLALTGVRQRVRLEGSFDAAKNAFVLAGPVGTGECTVVGTALHCLEHLPGVTVDQVAAAKLTPPSVDAEKRKLVLAQFPSDPVGILDATLGDDDSTVGGDDHGPLAPCFED
jgi:hypothetical protein